MRVHVLSGGRLRMRKGIYLPGASREEAIELPVPCFLLRHPGANVLFDTGCHPDTRKDAAGRWGAMARAMTPISGAADDVLSSLAALGLGAGDIDVVVASHLHSDHCGCNEFFRGATLVCHARELDAARAGDAEAQGYVARDWDHPLALDVVEGERDLFGDERIVLVPLPGHTPGSLGARLRLERSGTFLLAADALSLRQSLSGEFVPKNTRDAGRYLASLAEIRRIERAGATVICGHDDEQWRALRKGADAYD